MNRLKEYRERHGLTQDEAIAVVRRRALARGDAVVPGLDQTALSRHENGHKRPGPYYRALYGEVYGATPAALGFCVALPGETGDHEDVDRREFLVGAAGFVASAAVEPVAHARRLGDADVARLRQSVTQVYASSEQHGEGSVYGPAKLVFHRVRGLVERASYDPATGRALRELAGETARRIASLEFHAGRHDDARRWQLEAMHWAQLAAAAEDGARTALSLSDPVAYPRDHALDLTNLAYVLVHRRKIDESVAIATRAAVAAAGLESHA